MPSNMCSFVARTTGSEPHYADIMLDTCTISDALACPQGQLDLTGLELNRYPDPQQMEVKKLLAEMRGVRPEQIFVGVGSDEAIDLLMRIFCRPGEDTILVTPPTYGMYKVFFHASQQCADSNMNAKLYKVLSWYVGTLLGATAVLLGELADCRSSGR